MFLHLGGEYNVPIKNVIFIIDVESSLQSKDSKNFLNVSEQKNKIIKVTDHEPKSIVVTKNEKRGSNLESKIVVYYSPISSITLLKRAGFTSFASLETEVI